MLNSMKRTLAAAELLMAFPAALFMTALFVRNIQPQQYEPAHTAERIVTWYATHPPFSLWILLIALPIAVVVIGGGALLQQWRGDAELLAAAHQTLGAIRMHFATLLIALATSACAVILAIVALHVVTD